MLGNHEYGALPIGDASPRPQNIVVNPSAIGLGVSPQAPAAAIDAVIAPEALALGVSQEAPAVAIDAVVFAGALSLLSSVLAPSVYAPLPIARMRERTRCAPVLLAEVELNNGGPVLRFADRTVSLLGERYEDYLDPVEGVESVRFRNGRFLSYERLIDIGGEHPFGGAPVTLRECLLDDDGTPSEAAAIARGVLNAPREAGPLSFTCDVLPMESSRDLLWKQDVIESAAWPGAYEDLGEMEPFVYGSGVLVPALRVDWGARSTLAAKISAAETSLELSDASRFPQSDFHLWLDDEKVHVSSRSGNVCAGITRGADGTAVTAHRAGADAWEARPQYDSLLASHELYSVGEVYAEVKSRLMRVTSGVSTALENGKHILRATERIGIRAIEDEIGVSDGIAVGDDIAVTVGGANRKVYPTGSTQFSTGNVDSPGSAYDGNEATSATINQYADQFTQSFTIQFPATYYGAINTQWVHAKLLGDINVGGGWTPSQISATTAGWFRFQKQGGGWGDDISFGNTDPGEKPRVYEVYKEVDYTSVAAKSGSAYRAGAVAKSGTVVATHNVERFHAVVTGIKDDAQGTHTGTPGALIARPDHVIKHFVVERMGFPLDDIDAPSFSEAGAAFAQQGYAFAFRVGEKVVPSEFLGQMARECRSALRCIKGKWKLQWLPDAAPSAVKKISAGELAGEFSKFIFSRTPLAELSNEITARYRKNYSRMGADTEWDATASASDSESQAKYGAYPASVDFELIRDASMASGVLAHMLTERKAPRLTVEFPVYYEHFDLEPGQTIEIGNPLFNNRKFRIESIRRLDKFRAEIVAKEWW